MQTGFTLDDIVLPNFFRNARDAHFALVRDRLRDIATHHGQPETIARSNGPATWASRALTGLRRLEKLLVWTLAICASFLENVVMPKPRAARHRNRDKAIEHGDNSASWRIAAPTLPTVRFRYVDDVAPEAKDKRERKHDVMRALARKIVALRRVLRHPERTVLRLARRFRQHYLHIGWRPPKRPPPGDRRAYWDDLADFYPEARWIIFKTARKLWRPP